MVTPAVVLVRFPKVLPANAAGAHVVPFHCNTWPLFTAPIELRSAALMEPSRIFESSIELLASKALVMPKLVMLRVGVVVPVATEMGAVPVTLVTVPPAANVAGAQVVPFHCKT